MSNVQNALLLLLLLPFAKRFDSLLIRFTRVVFRKSAASEASSGQRLRHKRQLRSQLENRLFQAAARDPQGLAWALAFDLSILDLDASRLVDELAKKALAKRIGVVRADSKQPCCC